MCHLCFDEGTAPILREGEFKLVKDGNKEYRIYSYEKGEWHEYLHATFLSPTLNRIGYKTIEEATLNMKKLILEREGKEVASHSEDILESLAREKRSQQVKQEWREYLLRWKEVKDVNQ